MCYAYPPKEEEKKVEEKDLESEEKRRTKSLGVVEPYLQVPNCEWVCILAFVCYCCHRPCILMVSKDQVKLT